jgi:L-fuconolactonase
MHPGLLMRVDSHQHFWRLDRGDYTWLTRKLRPIYRDFQPADLGPILHIHEIDATVLVQAAATLAETDYMLDLAAKTGFVLGVVGWVEFDAPHAASDIERLSRNPRLKGLRPMIQDISDPEWMLRPALRPAIEAMQRQGLRFDALLKPPQLAAFRKFLTLYPDLPIVIDHGAKPVIAKGEFDDWAAAMREIAKDRRVHCKLSGLATEAKPNWHQRDLKPYADLLIESFGPDRLMWGSDWPVVELAGGYDRWIEATANYVARLNEGERNAILGGTAVKFYGL